MKLEEVAALWEVSEAPNCVQIISAWEQSGILFIETEFCSNGRYFYWDLFSLLDLINEYSGCQFHEEEIWDLIRQLSEALSYIHSKGYVHLDLKPENILLSNGFSTSKFTYKISDFGLARKYQHVLADTPSQQFISDDVTEGDKIYLAPEILSGAVSPAADVFR